MKLYSQLADWWPLLSSPDEYRDEAEEAWRIMAAHSRRPIRTMLELGSGGGNNAVHLKRHASMTLTDLSPQMIEVSRRLNPECEHIVGDMRTLRLGRGRVFDAVFIHDAVMYMTSEPDLRQAVITAFEHCAPGGVALFLPDVTKETWVTTCDQGGCDDDGRAMRYFDWEFDPDPTDTQFVAFMAFFMRESGVEVRVEHELHRFGLFPRATWLRLLGEAGFEAAAAPGKVAGREVFLGTRKSG